METLQEKISRVLKDEIVITDYNPQYPAQFEEIKKAIQEKVPPNFFRRIEHFGSTAVPGLAAKPIIDVLIEVESLKEADRILPALFEPDGADYFWRPSFSDNIGPWYSWIILRHADGRRQAHLHIVEADFKHHWDRLYFRDYLRLHPEIAEEYARLKYDCARSFRDDRENYTKAKSEFITRITALAKQELEKN